MLILQALEMALRYRQAAAGLTFHSDHGVQYASGNFGLALTRAGSLASMSRASNCYENAALESLWISFSEYNCFSGG